MFVRAFVLDQSNASQFTVQTNKHHNTKLVLLLHSGIIHSSIERATLETHISNKIKE